MQAAGWKKPIQASPHESSLTFQKGQGYRDHSSLVAGVREGRMARWNRGSFQAVKPSLRCCPGGTCHTFLHTCTMCHTKNRPQHNQGLQLTVMCRDPFLYYEV